MFTLQLQSLPAPAKTIESKQLLLSDNIPVVMLARWPVTIPWFSRDTGLKGPIPVIFTEEVEKTREAVAENMALFKTQLTKVFDR